MLSVVYGGFIHGQAPNLDAGGPLPLSLSPPPPPPSPPSQQPLTSTASSYDQQQFQTLPPHSDPALSAETIINNHEGAFFRDPLVISAFVLIGILLSWLCLCCILKPKRYFGKVAPLQKPGGSTGVGGPAAVTNKGGGSGGGGFGGDSAIIDMATIDVGMAVIM